MKFGSTKASLALLVAAWCFGAAAPARADIGSAPVVEVGSRPAVEVQSRPAVDVQSRPAVDVQSRPAVDVQSRPPVEVDSRPQPRRPGNDNQSSCNVETILASPPPNAMMEKISVSGVRCEGLKCEVSYGLMEQEAQLKLSDETFSDEESPLVLVVVDARSKKVVERRTYTNWIALSSMPSGQLVFGVAHACGQQWLAKGIFTISRADVHAKQRNSSSGARHNDPSWVCFPNCGYVSPSIYSH